MDPNTFYSDDCSGSRVVYVFISTQQRRGGATTLMVNTINTTASRAEGKPAEGPESLLYVNSAVLGAVLHQIT